MTALKPFFVYLRAKKKAGQKDHVFWETRASKNRVTRDAANAMEDAGLSEEDFFSPAVTNFHVVDDLPPEGVLDSSWCERYQLASDKMNWEKTLAPKVQPLLNPLHQQRLILSLKLKPRWTALLPWKI